MTSRARELANRAGVDGSLSSRNRIINGAMVIDQRNAGAAVTPASSTYALDRWRAGVSVTSKYSVQQSAVAPSGFSNSLLVTSLSAYSVGADETFVLQQLIEGFNTFDLGWGTASAKTVTLSFWVRSSLTGTFGGCFANGAHDRAYPFTYTISSADTWEQKTITVVGDTSGTWVGATNGAGVRVYFNLGSGSTVSGTAGAWTSGFFVSATGATSVVGTSGATFYITGVQLEAGDVATPFEHRSYGQELALCQRYYYLEQAGTMLYSTYESGFGFYESSCLITGAFPVPMRASPTVTFAGETGYFVSIMSSVTPTGDIVGAAPSSGAPGLLVVGPSALNRASMPRNGLVRGVHYRNINAGTLAIDAEL